MHLWHIKTRGGWTTLIFEARSLWTISLLFQLDCLAREPDTPVSAMQFWAKALVVTVVMPSFCMDAKDLNSDHCVSTGNTLIHKSISPAP